MCLLCLVSFNIELSSLVRKIVFVKFDVVVAIAILAATDSWEWVCDVTTAWVGVYFDSRSIG